MMKNTILLICAFLLFVPSVQAQQETFNIEGTVYNETGETMPGVTIYLKGRAGIGTFTDAAGKFTIKANMGDVVVFSSPGYDDKEHLVVKGETDLRISLSPTAIEVEEVVVVGMGTQRKISVVGAVSSVKPSELQVPATSMANLLGGRVAGVISLQSSGEPGKNISEFWVRGIGTFGANSSALVLIDGLEGNLNSVDPADVESFSVLKDASATAVYGVRGANGVVIITTKRGVTGRLKISARANWTLSNLNKMPEYMGAYDYARLANEARVVRGDEPLYNSMELDLIRYGLDPDLYPNVNWQKEIMKKQGFQQTYYVSAQGGGEIARYFISLGFSKESAAYRQDPNSKYNVGVGYNTYNYRTNLDISLTKSTTVYLGTDGYLSLRKQPGILNTNSLWYAQSTLTPLTIPTVYSTGQLPAYGPDAAYSPYVMLNHTGTTSEQNYNGKVTLAITQDFSSLVKGLKLRVQGAYDNNSYFYERRYVLPRMYAATGRNTKGDLQLSKRVDEVSAQYSDNKQLYRKYHFESTLSYENTFGSDHRVSGLVYYQMSDLKNTADTFTSGITPSMAAIPKRYQGLSGRITYGFKNTYMIDINFGYTGSENFQPGRQFGFFPAIAGGWVPTNYSGVRRAMPWLDFFKIRASYGSVGNDRITYGRFPYLTIVSETSATGWSGNTWGSSGITETSIGADNLMWEKAIKMDVGLEVRMLKERLSFEVDYFNDKRDGIFQRREQIPDYTGLLAMPFGNVGKMKSFGADGTVAFVQEINKDLHFTIRGNFTYSRNEVQNWEQAPQKYPYQMYNGYPNGAVRGYIATGLFRDEQDVDSSPVQNFGTKCMPGDIKYKDVNGDGKIDTDDRVALSDSNYPRLMYGFGGEINYKKLTLGFLFKGTGNTTFYHVGYDHNMGYIPFYGGVTGNVLQIVADQSNRWTPASYSGNPATENPNARFPRLTHGYNANNSQLSTWWKGNSRYLRLQEVSLSYNLNHSSLKKIGISSIDFQFVGSNLCVWDNVNLWDPEQAAANGRAYPIPARYTLQVYLNF